MSITHFIVERHMYVNEKRDRHFQHLPLSVFYFPFYPKSKAVDTSFLLFLTDRVAFFQTRFCTFSEIFASPEGSGRIPTDNE
jgi:hypothetical protein